MTRGAVALTVLLGIVWCVGAAASAASPQSEAINTAPYLLGESERPVRIALPGALWYDSEWAVIVSSDAETALEAAVGVRAAVAAFYGHFGVVPGRGAVLQPRYAALYTPLKSKGIEWFVPWTFQPVSVPLAAPSQTDVAAAIASHLVSQGVADPLSDLPVILRLALDHPEADFPIAAKDPHHIDNRSAFRHEIAHALFVRYIFPSTHQGQYGGDAPDWLDEAAALIVETPSVTQLRRRQFAEAVTAGRLPPLSRLLVSQHPLLMSPAIQDALAAARAAAPTVPVLMRLSVEDVGVSRTQIADFYASARGITDYLIERSGDRRILARIAAAIRKSGQPLSWVTTLDTGQRLSGTLSAMDQDFARWSAAMTAQTTP